MEPETKKEETRPELDTAHIRKLVEALVFSAESPVNEKKIAECIGIEGVDHRLVMTLIDQLNEQYYTAGQAFHIVKIAGGFQFVTMPDVAYYVARLFENKKDRKLTRAALETLSIIAYKQPITRAEIEAIRGVNADWLVRSLLEKRLITMVGRSEAAGKPLTYGTTPLFLETFGLAGLDDLPRLKEIDEILQEDELRNDQLEVEFDLTSEARQKDKPNEPAVEDDGDSVALSDDAAAESEVEDLDTALDALDGHDSEDPDDSGPLEDSDSGVIESDLSNPDRDRSSPQDS